MRKKIKVISRFQSTFPRGERLPCCRRIASSCYFNPRSLVGNDLSPSKIFPLFNHFNPRSLVGNDVYRNPKDLIPSISIHVPSWGTTGQGLYYHSQIQISIHVPSWGTTSLYHIPPKLHLISIHVPSWGTTANFHKYSLFFYAINIIFLLFIIPSLFSLVLFMLLF